MAGTPEDWDEAPMVIAAGAFDAQLADGPVTVPVSAGGIGGPVVGQAVVRAEDDGVVADMQLDGPRVPVGGMSFAVIRDGRGLPSGLVDLAHLEWPAAQRCCFMCGASDDLLSTGVCGDRAACDERMAAWRPTGLIQIVVTALILVAEFVSLARHFWLGVALSLVVDAGLIWWGVCEFARENGIQIRRVKKDDDDPEIPGSA